MVEKAKGMREEGAGEAIGKEGEKRHGSLREKGGGNKGICGQILGRLCDPNDDLISLPVRPYGRYQAMQFPFLLWKSGSRECRSHYRRSLVGIPFQFPIPPFGYPAAAAFCSMAPYLHSGPRPCIGHPNNISFLASRLLRRKNCRGTLSFRSLPRERIPQAPVMLFITNTIFIFKIYL